MYTCFSHRGRRIALVLFLCAGVAATAVGSSPAPDGTWEAIKKHPLPEWYQDAKFGIFLHWGVYSVPAWAPPSGELGKVEASRWFQQNPYAEWYANTMRLSDSPTWRHHRATYGENAGYLDFVPAFNQGVRRWKPDEWAKLFREVGARYVVLTTKHHDGFTLWPSAVRNPHRPSERQGSRRDLVGELTRAVRARGMRMGLYYSGGLDWSFSDKPIQGFADLFAAIPQTEEYARYADAQWQELIDRYRPSVLWNDIGYPRRGDVVGLFARFYARTPDGVINDRWGAPFSDFVTREYNAGAQTTGKKWEICRGLGFSFGYNRAEGPEHLLSVDKLVDLLADVVARNGNLLLNLGPRADGTLPEMQVERLRGLGRWLAVNGEAIFGSRPWVRAEAKSTEGVDLRFTRRGTALYAILLQKPSTNAVTIPDVRPRAGARLRLLGSKGTLTWSQEAEKLRVSLPATLAESEAYVLKVPL